MKNAVLLHGTFGNPDNFWFPWLKKELEAQGFSVSAPQLPDPDRPRLDTWVPYALDNLKFDQKTVLIGHSAGCPAALGILAKLKKPIKRTILVAGYMRLKGMRRGNPMLQKTPNWAKMKRNGGQFFFFNSDNDPWGCNNLQGAALRAMLGGTLIVPSGEGHFGSKTFKQPYRTFPLLKDICLLP
jgi:predicted alpha/beta hydrolase family esterase